MSAAPDTPRRPGRPHPPNPAPSVRRPRLPKTFGDYVGIAVSPVLIMVLVGSFVFMLLEIGYEGEHAGRLRWTLFWFVLASVLVSRISIEEGRARAAVYGMILAWATAMFIFRFVDWILGVVLLLCLIWWSTTKLVWDCTLIDEDQDASGEGLINASGLSGRTTSSSAPPPPAAHEPAGPSPSTRKELARRQRPHTPGVWVLYFSLAALPVFGLAPALIAADRPESRVFCNRMLWCYVAAALGLLLTTSFLGLRRYLRQRGLTMPASVAVRWITSGLVLVATVMLVAEVIPRPTAGYSLASSIRKVGSPQRETEPWMRDTVADPKGNGGEAEGEAEPSEDGSGGAPKPNPRNSSPGQASQGQGGSQSPARSAPPPTPPPWETLIRVAIIAATLLLLWRYRRELGAILRSLLEALRAFWAGRSPNASTAAAAGGSPNTNRPPQANFGEFRNPFSSGRHAADPRALILYTYAAVEAWAAEHGAARTPEQTPVEFLTRLSDLAPELAEPMKDLCRSYVHAAYAAALTTPPNATALQLLWTRMEENRARVR